jgi:carbamoyltransferase
MIDGGATCIVGDRICAIAEERLSRKKYAGGSAFALRTALNDCGISLEDVTHFYVSTCGERVPQQGVPIALSVDGLTRLTDMGVAEEKIRWVPSHHLSHAHAAFETSGLHRALVLVLDDAGSAMPRSTSKSAVSRWSITSELERSSYFVADVDSGYKLIAQNLAPAPLAGGCGTMYRYITDYLGLNGLTDCGKTMALAAYGEPQRLSKLRLLDYSSSNGQITRLQGPPNQSVQAVRELLHNSGYTGIQPRQPGTAIDQDHKDLAAQAQRELEDALVEMVRHLVSWLAISDICLAGGVALNCVLAGKLVRLPEVTSVFVAAAPGDTGQPLGNCLYGARQQGNSIPTRARTPYLGPVYSPQRVRHACEAWGRGLQIQRGNVAEKVAEALSAQKVVAVYHGRSELGPRALGHRSILADPRGNTTRDYLNSVVKHREPYRPYGMSILAEASKQLIGQELTSPFMMLAVPLLATWKDRLPAVSHVDGTSRVHTVAEEDSPWYRAIIQAFQLRTGIPAVLNTSFNDAGEPIVETPEDALVAFTKMRIDALAIEDWYLEKQVSS